MVHHHLFSDSINKLSVSALVSDLQDKEKVELWFSTEGGTIPSMYFLLSFLNSRAENIKIVLTDRLGSAGTLLLTDFKGEIVYSNLSFVMFHCFDRERYPLRKFEGFSDDKLQQYDKKCNLELAEKLKKFLSEKEIKKFLSGKDVIWYPDDIKSKLKEL